MSYIATRGFLGSVSDVARRGFGIGSGPAPSAEFSIGIRHAVLRPLLQMSPGLSAVIMASKINIEPRLLK